MRKLEPSFLEKFKTGIYKVILDEVLKDRDLDFQIRECYINIYYKGNSILKLYEKDTYDIHPKFIAGTFLKGKGNFDVDVYLSSLPYLKHNVINVKSSRPCLEIEFEQLLIRSNHYENTEVFITDRQFAHNEEDANVRFDLSGITWKSEGRSRYQTVPLTFIEVKYGLNNDIQLLENQIESYYKKVKANINNIAEETKYLLDTKADLGLFHYHTPDALKTLKVSDNIDDAVFIIALIDYNPNSKLFNRCSLSSLPFANQIKLFRGGFGIWDDYLKPLQ